MTRPAILDLDLVVVPREATDEMVYAYRVGETRKRLDIWSHWLTEEPEAGGGSLGYGLRSALSASPYPTAWDDVRKYVEGLERERYALAYAITGGEDAPGLLDTIDVDALVKMLKNDFQSHMEQIDRSVAAEARIAELEKRLADAERDDLLARGIIARAQQNTPDHYSNWHDAALAYMEGK